MKDEFKTESIYIRFDDSDKTFLMKDMKDHYNEMACFNKNKRGYTKFKQNIISAIKATFINNKGMTISSHYADMTECLHWLAKKNKAGEKYGETWILYYND